jgi:hypothetical protein
MMIPALRFDQHHPCGLHEQNIEVAVALFDILPRMVRSPMEICLGTRPSRAAKSRPLVTDAGRATKIPAGMSFEEATTLLVALQTMHDALVTNGRLSLSPGPDGADAERGAAGRLRKNPRRPRPSRKSYDVARGGKEKIAPAFLVWPPTTLTWCQAAPVSRWEPTVLDDAGSWAVIRRAGNSISSIA